MKGIRKTTNGIRNSQNCKCYACHRFCKRGLEAKTTRESSHRLFLKGAWSEQIAMGAAKRAKIANQMAKNALIEAVWGSKK